MSGANKEVKPACALPDLVADNQFQIAEQTMFNVIVNLMDVLEIYVGLPFGTKSNRGYKQMESLKQHSN